MAGEFTWELITLRWRLSKKKKLKVTPAQQLARLETRMWGRAEEKGSDNETMARKIAKKGKSLQKKDEISLSQLKEYLGMGFVELVVPIPFEEVKTKVFKTAALSWKLEDFQKGWRRENRNGKMDREGKDRRKHEIRDSQMEDKETI